MSKYKEQMDKIYVDDKMKMRVINKIKESNLDEGVSGRRYSFKKYGGIIAASFAFTVTSIITVNYTELINKEPIHISDEENLKNSESINSENKEVNNMESNFIIEDVLDNGINDKDSAVKNTINNEESYESERSRKSDKSSYSVETIMETSSDDRDINVNNSVNTIDDSKEQKDINHNNEEKDSYNSDLKTASRESDSERILYYQDNVPDLAESGFEVIYLNQISKNECEVMYSDLRSNRDLWIKIFNKETIDLNKYYSIISNVEYNNKEVLLCIDKVKNIKNIIYLKDNYVYCISSDKDMSEGLIKELLEYI